MPSGVYKRTEETKRKIGLTKRGKNHPNYGKHLSIKTRQKIGLAQKGEKNHNYGKHHSEEQKRKISNAMRGIIPKNIQKAGRWGNIKSGYYNINGKEIFFRSKMEANYALYLDFLMKQKQIEQWEYEPDVFIFEKIKFGVRSFRPDFKVCNLDKTIIYHETKGYMDKRSKTKIKRMAKYYPKVRLIIIDNIFYQDIKDKLGKMLKFY